MDQVGPRERANVTSAALARRPRRTFILKGELIAAEDGRRECNVNRNERLFRNLPPPGAGALRYFLSSNTYQHEEMLRDTAINLRNYIGVALRNTRILPRCKLETDLRKITANDRRLCRNTKQKDTELMFPSEQFRTKVNMRSHSNYFYFGLQMVRKKICV